MQSVKQYNHNSNATLDLPELKSGYFWEVTETRQKDEWSGLLYVILWAERTSRTPKLFRTKSAKVNNNARVDQVLVGHSSNFMTNADVAAAIIITAEQIYTKEFPPVVVTAPVSEYVGRYSA
jgi:hypothetical protein